MMKREEARALVNKSLKITEFSVVSARGTDKPTIEPGGFWIYRCPNGHEHTSENAAVDCVLEAGE